MQQIIAESSNKVVLRNGRRQGNRGYRSKSARKRAISMLKKQGFNYFVLYRDTKSEFALIYSVADWVAEGQSYTIS